MRKRLVATLAVVLASGALWAQEPPAVNWQRGPKTVSLANIAELELPAGYLFLNAKDTKALMERMGNVPDGSEVGLVTADDEGSSWFVVFEKQDVGYIKDDDKDAIDAKGLLESIREGTEEANKVRAERGVSAVHVVGWQTPPRYDENTHNLTWAILGRDDDGSQVVNFNVRLLGRRGYISATLVDDASKIALAQPHLTQLLDSFSYKTGHKYAEFRQGDKLATFGLAALVAGGAGAVAAKTGLFAVLGKLLAKAGKAIVLLVVGAVAALKRILGAIFGRGEEVKLET